MLRPLLRRASISDISKFSDFFHHHSLGSMLPPPEFATIPKVGLFTGSYELFREFAIVRLM